MSAESVKRRCLHCGMEAVSRRSSVDHRRFFKVISVAFYIWPETYYFQPDNPEHLRAWCVAHTDHRTLKVWTLPPGITDPGTLAALMEFAEALLLDDGQTRFGVWKGRTLQVATPLSIDWDTVGQKFFNHIRDQVFGLILDVTGMDSETLLVEYGKLPHGTLTARSSGRQAPRT